MELSIITRAKREIIDITDQIEAGLPPGEGVVSVFVRHTTAALTTADLDPGTDLDLLDFLEFIVPDVKWRHMHDPDHTPDHMLASLVGPSLMLPYAERKLQVGTWQRVILVELDGPHERQVMVRAIASSTK